MKRDPLNFFQPFESLPPGHENQLTRALLLVLRLSPIAHAAWLARVAAARRLLDLSEPEYVTQRREIKIEADPDEPMPLVSVFLTPAAGFDDSAVVQAATRGQVLDAIITYPGELVVVIENKIAAAENWQAANINISGVAVDIGAGQKPTTVLWPELLADFNAILERQLVGGAERAVLSDFLIYAEDQFPGLGPDQTLRLCAGNPGRTARRLRWVLTSAVGVEARIDKWGTCADVSGIEGGGTRVYLNPDEDGIALSFYPADTLGQARIFYAEPKLADAVRKLAQAPGWEVGHNFHFGHMEAGYAWTSGDIDADAYLAVWQARIGKTRQVPKEDWAQYFDWLVGQRIAVPEDREEFDKHFTNSNRQTATPRPGLAVSRHWALAEAEDLDAIGKFAGKVGEAYQQLRATFASF